MTKSRVPKRPPRFRSEAEERRFWETHDTSDYVDWAKAKEAIFPNLKPTTTTISLRLPANLLNDLKAIANRLDVPYQSLLKVLLSESIARERGSRRAPVTIRSRARVLRARVMRRAARR
jgi:predicted DNA binding CopG/RHH family protein